MEKYSDILAECIYSMDMLSNESTKQKQSYL